MITGGFDGGGVREINRAVGATGEEAQKLKSRKPEKQIPHAIR
jgi:hypothetical protein